MTLRFQQGEKAIFAVPLEHQQMPYFNHECVVDMVGPFSPGQIVNFHGELRQFQHACDYIIMFDDVVGAIVKDYQLRKINPPEEPASLTRTNEEEITA
jgi:hypothetical protein